MKGLSRHQSRTFLVGSQGVRLTDAQVARFEEQGFLELDRLTSEAEVLALQDVYDRLFEPGAGIAHRDRIELAAAGDDRPSLPQILNPDHYAPELLQTAAFRNARTVAGQILGESVQYMGMHAIRKPAYDGAETPWHQDEAYWDRLGSIARSASGCHFSPQPSPTAACSSSPGAICWTYKNIG